MTQVLEGRTGLQNVPRSCWNVGCCRLLAAGAGCRRRRSVIEFACRARRYVLDFAYLEPRLGLEVDGHGTHASRRERAADNTRMNALENAEWTIRRFTYEQVMGDPVVVASTVRSALGAIPKSGL